MESFSGVERVASDLERQARTLREEKDRLHEELSSARRMRGCSRRRARPSF